MKQILRQKSIIPIPVKNLPKTDLVAQYKKKHRQALGKETLDQIGFGPKVVILNESEEEKKRIGATVIVLTTEVYIMDLDDYEDLTLVKKNG